MLTILEQLSLSTKLSKSTCDVCEKSSRIASSFCQKCSKSLCDECLKCHKAFFSNHSVIPTSSASCTLLPPLTCIQHQLQVKFYCERDSTVVCDGCVTTTHKGHQLTEIKDIKDVEEIEEIKGVEAHAHERIESLQFAIENIKKRRGDVEQNAQRVVERINTHYDKLETALRARRTNLLDEVQKDKDSLLKNLTLQTESLAFTYQKVQLYIDQVNSARRSSDAPRVVNSLTNIRHHMDSFSSTSLEPEAKADLRFCEGTKLLQLIKSTGSLRAGGIYPPNCTVTGLPLVFNHVNTLYVNTFDRRGIPRKPRETDAISLSTTVPKIRVVETRIKSIGWELDVSTEKLKVPIEELSFSIILNNAPILHRTTSCHHTFEFVSFSVIPHRCCSFDSGSLMVVRKLEDNDNDNDNDDNDDNCILSVATCSFDVGKYGAWKWSVRIDRLGSSRYVEIGLCEVMNRENRYTFGSISQREGKTVKPTLIPMQADDIITFELIRFAEMCEFRAYLAGEWVSFHLSLDRSWTPCFIQRDLNDQIYLV